MVTELPTNFQNQFPSLICSLDQILFLPLFLLWQANTHTVKFMRKPFFLLIKKMHSYSFSKVFPLHISRNRKSKNIIKFIQGFSEVRNFKHCYFPISARQPSKADSWGLTQGSGATSGVGPPTQSHEPQCHYVLLLQQNKELTEQITKNNHSFS